MDSQESESCKTYDDPPTEVNSKIEETALEEDECTDQSISSQQMADIDLAILRGLLKKKELLNDPNHVENSWSNCNHFKADWKAKIKLHQSGLLRMDTILENCSWLTWIEDFAKPAKSTLQCRHCAEAKVLNKYRSSDYSQLANRDGVLLNTMLENERMIKAHVKTATHKKIIEEKKLLRLDEINEEIKLITKEKRKSMDNLVTKNVMSIVYYLLHMDLPLLKHKELMELVERYIFFRIGTFHFTIKIFIFSFGVNVGKPHCKSKRVPRDMAIVISNVMHDILCDSFVNDMPVSIVGDGSTDKSTT